MMSTYGFTVSQRKLLVVVILAPLMWLIHLIARLRSLLFEKRCIPKSIAILEPFGMGDVITHEPLVRVLQRNGYNVAFLGQPRWKTIIPESFSVKWSSIELPWTAVHFAEKYKISWQYLQAIRQAVRTIKKCGVPSIGMDTRGDIRSILLLHLAGCHKVYSLSHYLGSSMRIPPCGIKSIPQSPTKKRWEINMDFAAALGIPITSSDYRPPDLSHFPIEPVRATDGALILIPFAGGQGKVWPTSSWRELIRITDWSVAKIVALCGPGQLPDLKSMLGDLVDCHEVHSVKQWAAYLANVAAVVSVNTGPMHIAAAMERPLVALDGSSTLPLWAPPGKHSILLHHQDELNCAPCHQIDTNRSCGNDCMSMISPSEVKMALEALVSSNIANTTPTPSAL